MKVKAFVLILALAVACSDDDNSDSSKEKVESIAQTGSWLIDYYFDSDSDETTDYTNYVFIFTNDGAVTATNGIETHIGTWSVTSSGNDNSLDDVDFNIDFETPELFEELSDDWGVISISGDKIELIDVSGGNGETDYLTFVQNEGV